MRLRLDLAVPGNYLPVRMRYLSGYDVLVQRYYRRYMALGATMVTDEIYNTFLGEAAEYKTFYHGHSYTGNPLACAAGVAGLELLKKTMLLKICRPKWRLLQNIYRR